MDKKSENSKEEKKTRKKPERHPYKYDSVITEIRKVSPCNRTTLRDVAVEYFINAHRNDQGNLEADGVQTIAGYVVELRPKKAGKEIKSVSV